MTPLRRNFIIAAVVHVGLVGGLIAWELLAPKLSHSVPTPVEIVVPADILGDLPKGPGLGRGAYTPPAPTPAPSATLPMPTGAADETPAPTPTAKPVTPVRIAADEVAISTKPKPTVKRPAQGTKPKPTGNTAKSPAPTSNPAASADQIRQRFLKVAGNGGAGGTPYGDGRPAGGGTGSSKVIGSPDGSPNGVVGGVGAGSPNWEYYQHVHDRMYEAWEQPGSLNDKSLATTLLLKVGRDGKIEGATVFRSSGNKLMDNSALSAARKVGLLDPPPSPLLKGAEAAITVVFQVEG
jgi:TonB family protein